MKYKLINKTTNETHVCDKVIIDGFDYYVKEDLVKEDEFFLMGNEIIQNSSLLTDEWCKSKQPKVIASNDLSTNIPKVVTEEPYELLIPFPNELKMRDGREILNWQNGWVDGYLVGYTKSQESHSYSDDDIINLIEWMQCLFSLCRLQEV